MEIPIKMDDLGVPLFQKHPCDKSCEWKAAIACWVWKQSELHRLAIYLKRGNQPIDPSWVEMRHVSREKNPYYVPLYWLINRDPYIGLL